MVLLIMVLVASAPPHPKGDPRTSASTLYKSNRNLQANKQLLHAIQYASIHRMSPQFDPLPFVVNRRLPVVRSFGGTWRHLHITKIASSFEPGPYGKL